MFLLPAIGAWISDGLVLYIHFTRGGTDTNSDTTLIHDDPIAYVNVKYHFLDCAGYSAADCSRRRDQTQLIDVHNNVLHKVHEISFLDGALNLNDDTANLDNISSTLHNNHPLGSTLNTKTNAPEEENEESTDELTGVTAEAIESSTGYLAILAIIRLTLLSLPLSYAAFYGTRVICVICHYIFEGLSAMVVVSHMMAVLILNPSTLSTAEDGTATADPIGDSVIDGLDGVVHGDNNTLYENAWALLTLSLVSILLHFLIVLHVRSTGPARQDWLYEERRRKRKRMAYAMAARSNSLHGKMGTTTSPNNAANGESGSEDEEQGADGTPLLLPGGNFGWSNDKNLSNNSRKSFSSDQWREKLRCLPEQYGAFVTEAQARLNEARQMWMSRLEAVSRGQEDREVGGGVENSDAVAAGPTSQANPTNILTQATKELQKLGRPDPFKVLLQLFAYEDVWTNHRLDLAFSCDSESESDAASCERRAALSFYAPQLLSFLLHGAYLEISHRLEAWILNQCEQDLHFAHRCFWFLRGK